MATPITVQVTPGYLPADNELITSSILRQIAQPTVAITSGLNIPVASINFFKNGNFNKSDFLAPLGVTAVTASSGTAPALTIQNPIFWNALFTPLNTVAGNSKTCSVVMATDGPNGSSVYSAEIDAPSASLAALAFYTNIPSDVSGALVGQTMTFSIYIKNSQSATFTPSLSIWCPTSADQWATVVQSSTNLLQTCPQSAWTQMTFTFSVPTAASAGMRLQIDFPLASLTALAGPTCIFRMGQAQLVQGSTTLTYQGDPSLIRDIINPGSILASSTSWLHPDAAPVVPTIYDDEFDSPTLNTNLWTVTSGGNVSAVNAQGLGGSYFWMNSQEATGLTAAYTILSQNISSIATSAFEFTAKVKFAMANNASPAGAILQAGFGISSAGNTKSLYNCFQLSNTTQTSVINFPVYYFASRGNPTTGGTSIAPSYVLGEVEYFKVGYDGTNLYLSFSKDGTNFLKWYTEIFSSGGSFTATAIQNLFFYIYGQSQGLIVASIDWVRRTV